MWTISAVNKKFDGPLGSYNGLTDVHLAHFFSQPSRRSLLKTAKLITEDGLIVPEKNVKGELYLDEKKRKVYDILAKSILQNAVHKEGSWNKKLCNYLEDITKMAAVDKARKIVKKKNSKVASELFLEQSLSSRLPFENNLSRSTSKSVNNYRNILKPPNSAPVACFCYANGENKVINLKRSLSAKLHSPYGIPLILSGSFKEQIQPLLDYSKTLKSKSKKRRKFNNSVGTFNAKKNLFSSQIIHDTIPFKSLKFSQCKITMFYHGHLLLANFQKTLTQSIMIKQQHCGGTPVVIYKGKISANEVLSFYSLDHEGFFFSIIVFLNGIRELKLSSCCVFRYPPGRRLGGPNGTFSIKKIEGGKPCLKCQYQEYANNKLRIIPKTEEISVEKSVDKRNSVVVFNDSKIKMNDKKSDLVVESFEVYASEKSSEDSLSIHENEPVQNINEKIGVDEIEEELDDLLNQDIKEEIVSDEKVIDEANISSNEEEIKEQEESVNSISSTNQSEISEKFIEEEPQNYAISVGTSSEDEGENQHIISVSVHESPESS